MPTSTETRQMLMRTRQHFCIPEICQGCHAIIQDGWTIKNRITQSELLLCIQCIKQVINKKLNTLNSNS